jgi:hypothetical protein
MTGTPLCSIAQLQALALQEPAPGLVPLEHNISSGWQTLKFEKR